MGHLMPGFVVFVQEIKDLKDIITVKPVEDPDTGKTLTKFMKFIIEAKPKPNKSGKVIIAEKKVCEHGKWCLTSVLLMPRCFSVIIYKCHFL